MMVMTMMIRTMMKNDDVNANDDNDDNEDAQRTMVRGLFDDGRMSDVWYQLLCV